MNVKSGASSIGNGLGVITGVIAVGDESVGKCALHFPENEEEGGTGEDIIHDGEPIVPILDGGDDEFIRFADVIAGGVGNGPMREAGYPVVCKVYL